MERSIQNIIDPNNSFVFISKSLEQESSSIEIKERPHQKVDHAVMPLRGLVMLFKTRRKHHYASLITRIRAQQQTHVWLIRKIENHRRSQARKILSTAFLTVHSDHEIWEMKIVNCAGWKVWKKFFKYFLSGPLPTTERFFFLVHVYCLLLWSIKLFVLKIAAVRKQIFFSFSLGVECRLYVYTCPKTS